MKTSNEYISLLRTFLQQHAKKYGITSMGIFGSVARNEQHHESDLDVFVELSEADPVIMGFIHDDLQEICGCNIDLIRLRKGLNKLLMQRIERDAIYA
ncbi:MAG: nucleotidyltransferase family protein [Bacteroidia bacterium]|nr:nucleotidyltransferase family protein [Bacteroidia bacterium]